MHTRSHRQHCSAAHVVQSTITKTSKNVAGPTTPRTCQAAGRGSRTCWLPAALVVVASAERARRPCRCRVAVPVRDSLPLTSLRAPAGRTSGRSRASRKWRRIKMSSCAAAAGTRGSVVRSVALAIVPVIRRVHGGRTYRFITTRKQSVIWPASRRATATCRIFRPGTAMDHIYPSHFAHISLKMIENSLWHLFNRNYRSTIQSCRLKSDELQKQFN